MANFGSNDVSVLWDTAVIATLAVGSEPRKIDVDPVRGLVYVANRRGRSLSIISEQSFKCFLPMILKVS